LLLVVQFAALYNVFRDGFMDTLKRMDDVQLLVSAPRLIVASDDLTITDQTAHMVALFRIPPQQRRRGFMLFIITALLGCYLLV
jgi:hypothetical protein